MVDIRVFPSGYLQTNAYLLCDAESKQALLIDAPHFAWDEVSKALQETDCELSALLLTHGHYDHIGDAARIQDMGVPIYAHKADQAMIESPESMRPYVYPQDLELRASKIDHFVDEGQVIELMGQKIEVRHVPGHCPGNVLFYFPQLQAAFVGDALFAGSIGRYDLPGGDFGVLSNSIKTRIYTLRDDTAVYPGHGPETTVGDERETNPYVNG